MTSSNVYDSNGEFRIFSTYNFCIFIFCEEKNPKCLYYSFPILVTDDLTAYAKSTKFIPDKDIFDNISENNPVPKNILETPKLDAFVISLLTNTHNSFEITRDKQMTRISNKLRGVKSVAHTQKTPQHKLVKQNNQVLRYSLW